MVLSGVFEVLVFYVSHNIRHSYPYLDSCMVCQFSLLLPDSLGDEAVVLVVLVVGLVAQSPSKDPETDRHAMHPRNHFVFFFSTLRAWVCCSVFRTDTPGGDLLIGGYNAETGRAKGDHKSYPLVDSHLSSMMV